jgi:rhodanese-related sulfurtransferase
MKKLIYLLFVLLLTVPLVAAAQTDVVIDRVVEFGSNLPRGYGLISVTDLSGLLGVQDTVLLDVRQPEEYEAGHLLSSFNVPLRELTQHLDLLPDKTASIVVICKGGGRAMLAATSLQILGYENVKVLKGGYDAWAAEELPSTTDAYQPEAGSAPEFDADLLAAVDTYLATLPEGFALVSAPNLMAEVNTSAPVLIDVRSADERSQGYIAASEHIWIDEFVNRLDELPSDRSTPIVVFCQSGYRGGMAAVMLNLLGYTNVRNLAGGVNSWMVAGLPLDGVPLAIDVAMENVLATLPESYNGITAIELADELGTRADLLLVDVRTADEYAEGFISGAINLPLNELTQHLDFLPNLDAEIVVYCGSGHRSAIAMATLNLLGYPHVRSLLGGFGAWAGEILPVSTTPVEYASGTAPTIEPALFDALNDYITHIPAGYYTVRALDLSSELVRNPPLLIDVRSDNEWASGHIDGSINLPLTDLFTFEDQLPQDFSAPIVVYDNPTHRSSMALTFLHLLGYENTRALAGGTGAWEKAGLPLVSQ